MIKFKKIEKLYPYIQQIKKDKNRSKLFRLLVDSRNPQLMTSRQMEESIREAVDMALTSNMQTVLHDIEMFETPNYRVDAGYYSSPLNLVNVLERFRFGF